MNLEQIIRDELREVGAAVHPPPAPDPGLLVGGARQERARRLVRSGASVVLAAAVVLGIVLLGNALGHPTSAPSPAPQPTELPTGMAPQVPYIKNDVLYIDGRVRPGSWVGVITHQARSIAYLDDSTGVPETGTIALFRGASELARIPNVGASALSPNGRKAAWIERDGASWFAVVYDMETHREMGRLEVDAHQLGHVGAENEGWETLSAVDNNGVVTWGGVLKVHTWTPGSEPVASDPPTDPGSTPSGDFPVDDSEVSLSPDGTWGVWVEDRTAGQEQGTDETPDQYDRHLFAQHPGDPSSRFEFPLPPGLNISGGDWEMRMTVLSQVFDDPAGDTWHYVRCVITTRECEVAPTP